MLGRASYGRPWWPGVVAEALDPGTGVAPPTLRQEHDILLSHIEAIWSHYGAAHGNRIARKHLGWTVDRKVADGMLSPAGGRAFRAKLMALSDNRQVRTTLREVFAAMETPGRIAA
jgi:tRNA-dihydrouridine synthase